MFLGNYNLQRVAARLVEEGKVGITQIYAVLLKDAGQDMITKECFDTILRRFMRDYQYKYDDQVTLMDSMLCAIENKNS